MKKVIQLETGYKMYGNERGQQIDTLARAVGWWTENELTDANLNESDEAENYTYDNFDYEAEFIKSLTPKAARGFLNTKQLYDDCLKTFTEELKEKAMQGELDKNHALMVAIQKERDFFYDQLIHEWLHGDRSSEGLIGKVNQKYGVKLALNLRKDILTIDMPEETLKDMYENGDINRLSFRQAFEVLKSHIENDAYAAWAKKKAEQEVRREQYQEKRKLREEREAAEETERQKKLKKIIKQNGRTKK